MYALAANAKHGLYRHFLRYRKCICSAILALVFSFTGSLAIGAEPVRSDFAMFDALSFKWSGTQEMQLFGVPVLLRDFTAPISLLTAAQSLSTHIDRFQQVMAFKDKITLSGIKADWHWVAELEATSYGVKGLVSALHIDPVQLKHALENRSHDMAGWLPQQARLRFSDRSALQGRYLTQQVYSVQLQPTELIAYAQTRLLNQGWRNDPQAAWFPEASVWRRGAARLMLIAKEDAATGSSLFVHYFE